MLVYDCLSGVQISGRQVLESGSQAWVELGCSFHFISSEYSMLDIKWYFGPAEEPFLQWVPSSGREPQTVGRRFRSRVTTSHTLTNTTHGYKTDQVIRVVRPTIYTSGEYTCKVATFMQEHISTHNLLVFGRIIHNLFNLCTHCLIFQTLAQGPSSPTPHSLPVSVCPVAQPRCTRSRPCP